MTPSQPSLLARDDTFLGVCEALGEDFGFNPLYLRMALAVLLLWNPVAVLVGYVGAGVLVAASRWAFPKPNDQGAPVLAEPAAEHISDNDADAPILAMAA